MLVWPSGKCKYSSTLYTFHFSILIMHAMLQLSSCELEMIFWALWKHICLKTQ